MTFKGTITTNKQSETLNNENINEFFKEDPLICLL